MSTRPLVLLVSLACLLAAAPLARASVAAADAQAARPFPLAVTADFGAGGLQLAPAPAAIAGLSGLARVTLTGVPLPQAAAVDVELERVAIAADGAVLAVNGVVQPGVALDEGLSLWSGRVVGVADSEVFLAFSRWGSRGWIRANGDLVHLLAMPGADNDWSAGSGLLIGEGVLRSISVPATAGCLASSVVQPGGSARSRASGAAGTALPASVLPLLECKLAVETDFQYYQLFGNLTAATNYAVTLLGAVSSRYREQVGVIITLPYLGMHSTPGDPWTSQDGGGSSVDLLYEFQADWQGGQGPVAANSYHFLSGANLGGGVAFLPGICDPDYGFSVTGNIDSDTPFPIAVGPLNWDFIATAHEIGHSFNALHTHDYCPPLDECAPVGYFGACQTQQTCTSQGTIMSYCHLCGGGMLNETTLFHPQSVADMRAYATSSCLLPFKGVLASSLGLGKSGGGVSPSMAVTFTAGPDTLHLDVASAGTSKPGTVFLSPSLAMLPFKGGTLVPTALFTFVTSSSALGQVHLALPVAGSFPAGVKLYTQAWFKESSNVYAATNGVGFELIKP